MNKIATFTILVLVLTISACNGKSGSATKNETDSVSVDTEETKEQEQPKVLEPVDEADYVQRMKQNANGDTTGLWPVQNQPAPLQGAILPYKRVVAYYGNLYSKQMGALGEYPPEEMWQRLNKEVDAWNAADPQTPAVPAVHYIASVAQPHPTPDGGYRFRMPDSQIDSAMAIAKMHDALLFLDLQVGHSTVQKEVPAFEKYLLLPHVHLGIDPEFSMKDGSVPGRKIGTFDAEDINFTSEYLAKLVREHNLPPKMLVVHRFTRKMVTNYQNIILRPEVQVVIDMDGFGRPELKYSTYESFVRKKPVQFTGFKLFYKNDIKQSPNHLLTPEELLKLQPIPVYIQYQ
ncbi:MAG: hypothetical protein Q4G48_08870 [Bacteroidia bacterium]|nr:hypothetical protein [Bacteroidia bacterium]